MKFKHLNRHLTFQFIIGIIPIIFYIIIVKDLPDQLPLHYNAAFEPNKFGSKYSLLFILLLTFILIFFLCFIFQNVNISDKRANNKWIEHLGKIISWVLILLFLSLSCFIVYQTTCYSNKI